MCYVDLRTKEVHTVQVRDQVHTPTMFFFYSVEEYIVFPTHCKCREQKNVQHRATSICGCMCECVFSQYVNGGHNYSVTLKAL